LLTAQCSPVAGAARGGRATSHATNVRDFGAEGTGAGDDSAAFQRAIDAAGGNAVIVPGPGTYHVRGVSIATGGTIIECVGQPAIKLTPLEARDGSPIFNVAANDVTFRGCSFDGNKAAHVGSYLNDSFEGRAYRPGILMDRPSGGAGLSVQGCSFAKFSGAAVATRNVNDLSVTGCTFADNSFESLFASSSSRDRTYLRRATFASNTTVRARSGDPSVNANALLISRYDGATVDGNLFDTVERCAVKMEFSRNYSITNNIARNISLDPFGCFALWGEASGVIIRGNSCSNAPQGVNFPAHCTYWDTEGYSDITVDRNTFDTLSGSMADGVLIAGLAAGCKLPRIEHVVVSRNTFRRVGRYGIRLDNPGSAVSHIAITGNTVFSGVAAIRLNEDGATDIDTVSITNNRLAGRYGIQFSRAPAGGRVKRVSITGNAIDVTSAAISDPGAALCAPQTRHRDNRCIGACAVPNGWVGEWTGPP
jgi:hypothetical protein